MSTVLTNGIIIPENGSRNWGGDLANNWNIIDLNVGYMTDVKNRVATLENSVTTLENSTAENTANIQTNASNISALQTSKQDVIADLETIRSGASSGATAVQPSALNNYLPSTGGPITGNLVVNSSSNGWKPGFEWLYNNERYAYIHTFTDETKGEKSLFIQADTHLNFASQNLIFTISRTYAGNTYSNALNFLCKTDGTFNFYSNTPADLGTSTNKWKSINGTNPGGLSLPNASPSGFIGKSLPSSGGMIKADVDGWFEIRAKATSPNALIQLFVAGGNSTYAKNTGDTLIISVPLTAGISVTIFYKDIETPTVCRLVPCAGNV